VPFDAAARHSAPASPQPVELSPEQADGADPSQAAATDMATPPVAEETPVHVPAPAAAEDRGAAEPTDTASPSLFDKDGNPLTVLDEDALHDIVRQLIREELQGALGERITRNVRKLVRAEINRALTARTLD
jgi:hypothetical protein